MPAYRNGFIWLDPAYYPAVCLADIPLTQAQIMAKEQKPVASAVFAQVAGPVGWHTIPSWYLISGNDRMIDPNLEWWHARRMQAHARQIPSSHCSPVSHPYDVATAILQAIWSYERVH